MPKSDFSNFALQLYSNHTAAWCSPVNLLYIFRKLFYKNTYGEVHLASVYSPLQIGFTTFICYYF